MRFPRLEAMRARRDAYEAVLADPHRDDARRARSEARRERETRQTLERLLASPIAKDVMGQLARDISREIGRHVHQAVAVAMKADESHFTVTLPMHLIKYSDPKSVESIILDRFMAERPSGPSLRVSAAMQIEQMSYMRVRVEVPALFHEVAVDRLALSAA